MELEKLNSFALSSPALCVEASCFVPEDASLFVKSCVNSASLMNNILFNRLGRTTYMSHDIRRMLKTFEARNFYCVSIFSDLIIGVYVDREVDRTIQFTKDSRVFHLMMFYEVEDYPLHIDVKYEVKGNPYKGSLTLCEKSDKGGLTVAQGGKLCIS